MNAVLLSALLYASAVATASETPVAAPAPAPAVAEASTAPAAEAAAAKPDNVICRIERTIGSQRARRVCRPATGHNGDRDEGVEALQRAQRGGFGRSNSGG